MAQLDNRAIGTFIKELLRERNMKQEDLANLLNISKSAVSQNLNGKSSFDLQNLMTIANHFNLSVDELLNQKIVDEARIVSEYERIIRKGAQALERVNSHNLRICDKDIYGKILLDYIIEHNQVKILEHLLKSSVDFIPNDADDTKEYYIKTIVFMLKNNVSLVDLYLFEYIELFGPLTTFANDDLEFLLKTLNQTKHKVLLTQLMTQKVRYKKPKKMPLKTIKLMSAANPDQWLTWIAKYQLSQALAIFVKHHEVHYYSFDAISKCISHNYIHGVETFVNLLLKEEYTDFQKKQYKFQPIMLLLANYNLDLFYLMYEANFYTNLNQLLSKLMQQSQYGTVDHILQDNHRTIDYLYVFTELVKLNHYPLFEKYIYLLDSKDYNYLLAKTSHHQWEMIKLLLKQGARFDLKYMNQDNIIKANSIIQKLLSEGDKDGTIN